MINVFLKVCQGHSYNFHERITYNDSKKFMSINYQVKGNNVF